jgi:hypothetical protein
MANQQKPNQPNQPKPGQPQRPASPPPPAQPKPQQPQQPEQPQQPKPQPQPAGARSTVDPKMAEDVRRREEERAGREEQSKARGPAGTPRPWDNPPAPEESRGDETGAAGRSAGGDESAEGREEEGVRGDEADRGEQGGRPRAGAAGEAARRAGLDPTSAESGVRDESTPGPGEVEVAGFRDQEGEVVPRRPVKPLSAGLPVARNAVPAAYRDEDGNAVLQAPHVAGGLLGNPNPNPPMTEDGATDLDALADEMEGRRGEVGERVAAAVPVGTVLPSSPEVVAHPDPWRRQADGGNTSPGAAMDPAAANAPAGKP